MTDRVELHSQVRYPCQFGAARDGKGSFELYFSTLIRERRDPHGELSVPGIIKNQMFGTYTQVIDAPEITADVIRAHLPELARYIEKDRRCEPGTLEFILI